MGDGGAVLRLDARDAGKPPAGVPTKLGQEREGVTERRTSGEQCEGWEVSEPMEGLPVPPSTTRSADVFKIKSPRT